MSRENRLLAWSDRLYGWFLGAFPRAYRREYGPHMAQVFGDCSRAAYAKARWWGVVRLWPSTFGETLVTAIDERLKPGWSRAIDPRDVGRHVRFVGWLYLLVHGFILLSAAAVGLAMLLFVDSRGALADPAAVLSLLAAVALPGAVAGAGLLRHQRWARPVAMIVGVLQLGAFPVGTVIGLYALGVLLQEAAASYFTHATRVRARSQR